MTKKRNFIVVEQNNDAEDMLFLELICPSCGGDMKFCSESQSIITDLYLEDPEFEGTRLRFHTKCIECEQKEYYRIAEMHYKKLASL